MVEYNITNLSDNGLENEDPQIQGNNVVWEGKKQIFFYDGSQTKKITDNEFENQDPQISGNNIVWEGFIVDPLSYSRKVEVFIFDGQTTTNSNSPAYRFNNDPQISGNNVVWELNNQILLYNISTGKTQPLADTSFENKNPQISGNNVVWQGEGDDSDSEIVLYDGTQTRAITNNNFDDNNPQISGNIVVWEGNDQIFFYNIQTKQTTQVTNNSLENEDPQVSGNYIVWEAYDGNDEEIFLYNIGTGSTTQLTDNNTNDEDPQISGTNIVWEGFDGSDEEIFYYDIETQEITQVTDNNIDDEDPQISGKNIVWEADNDIFLATPMDTATTPIPVVNLSISPNTGSESDKTTFTITVTADKAVSGTQSVNIALSNSGSATADDFDTSIPSTITIEEGATTGTLNLVVKDDNLEEGAETATFTISNPSSGITLGGTTSVSATIEASDQEAPPTEPDPGTPEYNITNLSNNGLENEDPQIQGNKVVWEGNKQIFFYDGNETKKITNNAFQNQDPQISGNNIVWEGFISDGLGAKKDVFIFDGETTVTTDSPIGTFNDDPQISGDKVVWAVNNQILLYDISTDKTENLADTSFENKNPQISGNNVVWEGEEKDGDKEIVVYDGTTTRAITNNNFEDNNAQISGNNVVWEGEDPEGNDQIFFYNIQTKQTTQITNNSFENEDPQISGKYIVWEAYDGNDEEIFLYNIDTDSTTQLTDNDTNDQDAQISGDNIVWEAYDGNDKEIFLYDVGTQERIQITNNGFDDEDPQISGKNIVWEANNEIFLATPVNTPTTPIPVVNLSISPNSGSEADRTTFTITATADRAVSGTQTVRVALSGSSSASADDFDTSIPTKITIEDGATTGRISLVVKNDTLDEGAETATLTISDPSSGIALGDTTSVEANIAASDRSDSTPTVNLSIAPSSGSESDGTSFTITATADRPVSGTQTVNIALTDSATENDFDGNIPSTITITDEKTTGRIEVVVKDDILVEGEETATFTISNPSSGIVLGDTTSASATIEDNDTTNLPVINLSINPGNGSEFDTTTFTITATTTSAVSGNQTLAFALTGTADDNDFDGDIPTTITIEDGNTTGTIELVVTDDDLKEEAETAIFTISNPSNGIALGNNISVSANIEASDQIEREDRNFGDDGVTQDFSSETTALNIAAGSGNDNIRTGSGDDIIDAGAGNNIVKAGPGNDVIDSSGESGTDNQIDGGEGTDTVRYDSARADFPVARFANGTVRVGNNTDTLTNVEKLKFTDQTVSVADLPITTLDDSLIRFRNTDIATGAYLFAGEAEAAGIRENFIPPFAEEGEAFKVSLTEKEGLVRFNRFRNNNIDGTYIFATEAESVSIRRDFAEAFTDEGTAFYAYGGDFGIGEDVIRFRNKFNGTYIFALGEEAQNITDNFSDTFAAEGVAFEV